MSEIYQPEEDSFLMSEVLEKVIKKNDQDKILDMGSGSGIQAKTLINLEIAPENLTLADTNPKAIKHLKKEFPKSKVVRSNLFSNIKEKYDLIVFNPPYLPKNKLEPKDSQIATTGGKEGSEIINKFLREAKKHLNKNGRIILLMSSLTQEMDFSGYKKKLLRKKKMFFEELMVWELELD